MTDLKPVEEDTGRRRTHESEGDSNEGKRFGNYRAALKLTSPWLPIMAVVMTALTYLLPEELLSRAILLIVYKRGGSCILRRSGSCLHRLGCNFHSCSQPSYRKRVEPTQLSSNYGGSG
jgi:hypothetical protein